MHSVLLSLTWHFCQELLQLGAAVAGPDEPLLTVDELADQIAEILDYFG